MSNMPPGLPEERSATTPGAIKPQIHKAERRGFLAKSLLGVADQMVVGAVSMLIGIALVRANQPIEYGIFTGFVAVFYLWASVQNAVINTPLIVLSPRIPPDERSAFSQGILSLNAGIVAIGMLLSALVGGLQEFKTGELSLAPFLVAFCMGPLLWREYMRAREFAALRLGAALIRDSAYAVMACVAVVILWQVHALFALAAFAAYSLPALVVSLPSLVDVARASGRRANANHAFRIAWPTARWSLLGAVTSWLQANAYIYVPLLFIGAKPVGLLAAARLALTPVILLLQAWPNFVRPIVTKRLVDGRQGSLGRLLVETSLVQSGLIFCFSGVVVLFLEHGAARWIPTQFVNAVPNVRLWAAVLLLQGLRTNVGCFLQAHLDFFRLFVSYAIAAVIAVGGSFVGVFYYGPSGSLAGIFAGETALFLLLCRQYQLIHRGETQTISTPTVR